MISMHKGYLHANVEELCQSGQTIEDFDYARMIDGRTIHQFLTFVLPFHCGRVICDFSCTGLEMGYWIDLMRTCNWETGSGISLSDAVSNVACLWYEADCDVSSCDYDPGISSIVAGMMILFVDSEYKRRCAIASNSSSEIIPINQFREFLEKLPPSGLTAELLSYWYPGWRRSLIIFESPLDHVPDYEGLKIKHIRS